MGFKDVDWAHKLGFKRSTAYVLAAIAHHTDDKTHQTFVGQQKIAAHAGCSAKQVRRAVDVLRVEGVITTERQNRADGGNSTLIYTLNVGTYDPQGHDVPTPADTMSPGYGQDVPGGTDVVTVGQGHHVPGKEITPSVTQEITPSVTPSARAKRDELFETVWKHWPRGDKKKSAKDKFARFKPSEVVDIARAIIAHGDAYSRYQYGQYTPHLITWLNQERWTEDLPKPRNTGSKTDQGRAAHEELLRRAAASSTPALENAS